MKRNLFLKFSEDFLSLKIYKFTTNKYHLSVISNVQPQQKKTLMQANIQSPTELLDKISEMDSILPYYNYQVSFFREGISPDLHKSQNGKEGGHFVIFFSTNIQAFRSFCIFSVDWMNNFFDFSVNIEGILVAIKNHYWYLQIWVNDGYTPSKIVNRYYALNGFLRSTIGITDQSLYQIGFQIHSQKTNTHQENLKAQAISIPTFQECINKVVGDLSTNGKEQTALFDLNVVNLHKRSRKERRLNPSYVDNVKNT